MPSEKALPFRKSGFTLFFLSLLFFWPWVYLAQNIDQTFLFAQQQLISSDYSQASEGFQRVLFFDDGTYRGKAYHYLGDCNYETHDYEKASRYYDLAFFSEKNDSLKTELIFRKTSSLLMLKRFNDGIAELLNIDDAATEGIRKKRDFYFGIAYFGLNETGKAEEYFLNCIDPNDIQAKEKLGKEFESIKKINNKSPKMAKILSIILPGAGQFYSRDFKNGFNSLFLNAAFIGLGVVIAKSYTPFDAVIAVFPWFQRYYTGGIKKSEIIAIQKINKKREDGYQKIMDIIYVSKK